MIEIHGIAAINGYAIGKLKFISDVPFHDENNRASVQTEWNNFCLAHKKAVNDLEYLANSFLMQSDETAGALMQAHSELAQDIDFLQSVKDKIFEDGLSALQAVLSAGKEFAQLFIETDDDYLRERASDIQDVANRIGAILNGDNLQFNTDDNTIWASPSFSPSQIISLDKAKTLAVVSRDMGINGHAVMLLKSYNIPCVVGIKENLCEYDNKLVIVDGYKGDVIIEPSQAILDYYTQLTDCEAQQFSIYECYRGLSNKTKDNKEIKLYCNIHSLDEISDVFRYDANGIGLFRTEFLFVNRNNLPSEEEQFQIYKATLEKMNYSEVIIRTADIGADKNVQCLNIPKEENPALGLRGLRLGLKYKNLLVTQLRALYRASVYGKLLIMFPMITSLDEIFQVKSICSEIIKEFNDNNIPFSDNISIGIMIETPAAALISDKLAEQVDFFSIGSNDLTQYTLACDRMNDNLSDYYNPMHPAVIQLIDLTIKNAHNAGIWVGICGDMASHPENIPILIELGVDELSVMPSSVLKIRKAIREN